LWGDCTWWLQHANPFQKEVQGSSQAIAVVVWLFAAVQQVKMVSPQEVQFASARGALVVDVRPEADFDAVSRCISSCERKRQQ
jgi:hypothetical protein